MVLRGIAMIRLEKSEALGRKIRQDDPAELAIPTWTLVREAIQSGRSDAALDFLEYGCAIDKALSDGLVAFIDELLTHLATLGEEEVYKFIRKRYYPRVQDWLARTPGVEESLQREVENQRGHYGNVKVTEETDRYVVRCDPCGTGGRLRRVKNVEVTKKAYPWSWGKAGIPYYCTHCSVMWEIIPIELRGYPIAIFLPGDKPEDPCLHLYYKKPELIPEEYFTMVGKTKTIK